MTTSLSAFTMGVPNKGYSKSVYDISLTAGTYFKTPDNSTSWSNRMEAGAYLNGTLPVGERTTLTPNISLGYANAKINSDIETPGTIKDTFTFGFGLSGKVAVTDNIAVTASAGYKLQGYDQIPMAEYMDDRGIGRYITKEDSFSEEEPGFGYWYVPGDLIEHYGSHVQFLGEMDRYNNAAKEYNKMADEINSPKYAEKGQGSLGVEFTNNNNTVTGGVQGIFTHYSGFGCEKETGNNFAAEVYGSVDVGHGVKINGAVNTNKTATVGVSITGLLN